jgi:hypothetical protein
MRRLHVPPALLLTMAALAVAPATGYASDDEVRTAGTCGAGAASSMRLRADDGEIELRFEARHGRPFARWRIVVVQERRVVWRGRARARSGRVRVRRRLTDLQGVDRITVTASGPGGLRCVASGALPG